MAGRVDEKCHLPDGGVKEPGLYLPKDHPPENNLRGSPFDIIFLLSQLAFPLPFNSHSISAKS